MSHFDVFNGDADGICALHQLRLAQPRESVLVTGVKRDIELLARVPAQAGDTVTVLDVSLDRNLPMLSKLLDSGVEVEYFDHHSGSKHIEHARLRLSIDSEPLACTSTIVDHFLQGRHRLWAVVGAFGDNLGPTARALGQAARIARQAMSALHELGEAINYNSYGESLDDLLVPPAQLYETLRAYASPFDFIRREPLARALSDNRRRDLEQALAIKPATVLPGGAVYVLPDAAWARRVQGEFANVLAQRRPRLAHAVLAERGGDKFCVSVRAPLRDPQGAERLCSRFVHGGGRSAAAGIDDLPVDQLANFVSAFDEAFNAER